MKAHKNIDFSLKTTTTKATHSTALPKKNIPLNSNSCHVTMLILAWLHFKFRGCCFGSSKCLTVLNLIKYSFVFLSIIFVIQTKSVNSLRVENLKESNKDVSSITIEWVVDDSTATGLSDGENEWIGFKIKYFTNNLQFTPVLLRNANLRKFRLDNLKSNTEYKIQVSAFNKLENEGPASNLLSVRTSESVPGEPQDLKVAKVTSNSIELEWKAPKRDEQTRTTNIKGYEIHYFKVMPNTDGAVRSDTAAAATTETQIFKRKTNDIKKLKYVLTNLDPNSLYKIQIFAYNMKGDGQRSNPLLVNTLDEGPNKPENIKSEIFNDLLQINWQPPSVAPSNTEQMGSWVVSAKARQKVGGYRLYFKNEKYELDESTTQITFQRPKWDYDKQYEFRIAAKSANPIKSSSEDVYGQEAFYRISTYTNQSKIVIQLEKLTSTSILIKWNHITFNSIESASMPALNNAYYKLEYWTKAKPESVITHDRLNKTDLLLKNLIPNTDYIAQLVGYLSSTSLENSLMTSEPALKHFRTLVINIEAPNNLKVVRFEPDKINIKWDPVVLTIDNHAAQQLSLIKGYKIYYKEFIKQVDTAADEDTQNPIYDVDESLNYYMDGSEEWKVIEQNGDKNTEIILEDLHVTRDYAIKVTAYDFSNNEGPESTIQTASHYQSEQSLPHNGEFSDNGGYQTVLNSETYSSSKGTPNLINESIGKPRDLEVLEFTDSSIKFSWMPPMPTKTNFKINNFLISYVDRMKTYRDSTGDMINYRNGITTTVKVPARGDPTIKIMWLVAGLMPNTYYDFNISAQLLTNEVQGPVVHKIIKTKPYRPAKVDPPYLADIYTDNTVLIKTGNASEKNGPILKYWLVVTPIGVDNSYDMIAKKSISEQNYETRDKDITNLLRYSMFNGTLSNETTYITAEFEAIHWPTRFILGDGNTYGRFLNRKLIRSWNYRAYIIAFTDQQYTVIKNKKQMQLNMVGLSDLLNTKTKTNPLESQLFTSSVYSEVFNTNNLDALNQQNAIMNTIGISVNDFHNILWVAGAIACFIFLIVIIIVLSLRVMQKKNKLGSNRQIVINNNTLNRGVAVGTASSTTTTTNLINTTVTFEKMGTIRTNTLKSGSNNNNTLSKSSNGNIIYPNKIPVASSSNHQIRTSSSSSSSTASPTTALLSCSVNNFGASSQSSNSNSNTTNNTNILLNTNGLLTTASPLKLNNAMMMTSSDPFNFINPSEGLYTSIEVTQKLLQQQLLQNTSNPYDNNSLINTSTHTTPHHQQQQMMMMMMNNSANTFQNSMNGTLSRNTMSKHNNMSHQNYDPIELRRIQYQTAEMLAHPAIQIDELFQYLERLKAQSNAKFSLEYESIEPGQQFTWEHSILDINRQKNRYANVIAYDHSRVVLAKLPAHLFANLNNTLGAATGNNNNYQHQSNGHYGLISDFTTSSSLPPPPAPPPGTNTLNIEPQSPTNLANCSDYINANYQDGYRKKNVYIATQGPLPSTICDFWRMVWEQQTCTIVMMTKLEERNRLKCDQYWPQKGTEIYDNTMQVTLVDFTELSTYSIRTFVITPVNMYAQMQIASNSNNINFEMRREIKHFQFTAWPDHGVPDHPTSFLMFLRRVKSSNPIDSGPIVVHCSAGVGRTGCYIVLDTMLERLKHESTVDIYGHTACLRAQRNYMIQTEDQYVFAYDAVLEASQSGHTEVPTRNLYTHLQRLLQINSDDPTNSMLTEMELEYKRLSNIKAPQSKFQSANLASNKFKNRLVNILPYESTRVCLTHLPNVAETVGSDYINANFIDGYKYKKAYIATQAPLTETIDDFWRMLWEHNSTIIVCVTKLREMGREKCSQYWPNERSIRYQYFVVDPIAEYNMSQYILREFKVTDARDGQSRTIRQFQYIDWPEQGVPKSGESIIELIGQVHKTKEQFGQTGPITVHCSAGVGRTGVFITLSVVLERMRYEGVIDVFNTVKLLRTQRPAMVQTEDQYQFCYRAALEYLGSFDNE